MNAKEMLYEFELSVDRISSKGASNLPLPAKVTYINRGVIATVLSKYNGNTKERSGFEETQKRIQDLQTIHVTDKKVGTLKFDDGTIYYGLLSSAPEFMLLTRLQVFATKGGCVNSKMRYMYETQTDDLNEDLVNPNRKPSFEWSEVLYRIANKQIQVFTDKTFAINWVIMDYLRYPRRVDVTGYRHFSGVLSSDVDSDLPEIVHPDIIARAAMEWEFDIRNPTAESKALILDRRE